MTYNNGSKLFLKEYLYFLAPAFLHNRHTQNDKVEGDQEASNVLVSVKTLC